MDQQISAAERWLTEEDLKCFGERLGRLEWMVNRTPPADCWTFEGGLHAKILFEEMRYCFVYAQYLATVIVGLSFLETTLEALFFAAGRNDLKRASIQRLIKETVERGWVTRDLSNDLNRLNKIRNSYAHFRAPLEKSSIEFSVLTNDASPYEIAERDAAAVVSVALDILYKAADHRSSS